MLIIFIVGAVLSPGTDPVGQIAMAGPMVVLYLLSIVFAWIFGKKRQPAEEELAARQRVRAGELDRLIADLSAAPRPRGATRRWRGCACMGARALPHLAALVDSTAPAPARAARALGARRPRRSRAPSRWPARRCRTPTPTWRWPPSRVLRGWLTREDGTQALEAITATALDKRRDGAVRLAALDALSELPPELVAPIRERAPVDTGDQPALDDPGGAAARGWPSTRATAPLSALHAAVTGAREREQAEPAGRRRDEWTRVRGAAHVALAHRGSRVAVYDLRESFDRARDAAAGRLSRRRGARGRRLVPGADGARLGRCAKASRGGAAG